MDSSKVKRDARRRRHVRLRKKVRGTAQQPRLAVYRSNTATYAQLIDDTVGRTLAAASTLDRDSADSDGDGDGDRDGGKVGAARAVGARLAERARAAGIEAAVFDRGGNRYAGRVAALAEGAREAGLRF